MAVNASGPKSAPALRQSLSPPAETVSLIAPKVVRVPFATSRQLPEMTSFESLPLNTNAYLRTGCSAKPTTVLPSERRYSAPPSLPR